MTNPLAPQDPPPPGTLEAWAWERIRIEDVEQKLQPAEAPHPERGESWELEAPVRSLSAPGRSACLRVVTRSPKTPRGLSRPEARAQVLHTFLHHEVQAAELFAWAVLRFPDTPREFRSGLVRLCQDELRHARLYRRELQRLGADYGDYPVRDWFWEKIAGCDEPAGFCAFVGLGLEASNLEHSQRFASSFRAVGDEQGARIQEVIEREEIAHVAFAAKWFEHFTGSRDYDTWAAHLPEPLTPSLFRGKAINRGARLKAGLDEDFVSRLQAAAPTQAKR